ncbi:hypothetical protein [Urbifossiella limnaea]|uniref:Uncharacterized protein n=1 Tax=Urbifossiella limnaea TaxID=2528023 RepID=A0A517Y0B3_9BACT|nr:hypothetical protein [Urbifossiella limnaea]QDU23195.1 hypothetical protein ETAA1_51870 [Urbifossiella limnaea]
MPFLEQEPTGSDARFSHGICPDCWKGVLEPQFAAEGIEAESPYPG